MKQECQTISGHQISRVRWAGCVQPPGEMTNIHEVLVKKLKRKKLGDQRVDRRILKGKKIRK
jgi:hypothetical protein